MSTENTTPREIATIVTEIAAAQAELDKASTDSAKAKATEKLDGLNAEHQAARKARYDAVYASLQARYNAASGAGEKAALRRHMNRIREAQGLTALVAGTAKKTSGVVPADVLAMLREDGIDI